MTGKERERCKRLLERLREQVLAAGTAKAEPTRKDGSAVGVPDEDEQALTEMQQILASTRNRKQREELVGIDRALATLADRPDDYGVCEECSESIALRRLEFMPFATLCIECQAEKDPKRGVRRRSLSDI
ncbi:MAG: TraR/DksA family transcriptional regulator [Myxococcales bacterium]|nr:TraR/DksA family transcriptional regulator [Myxococcales bacterium]